MNTENIEKAAKAAGGQKADLARLLGISESAVSQWGGVIPYRRALEIEEKTNGAVTRHDLRPDIFGPPTPKRRKAA